MLYNPVTASILTKPEVKKSSPRPLSDITEEGIELPVFTVYAIGRRNETSPTLRFSAFVKFRFLPVPI